MEGKLGFRERKEKTDNSPAFGVINISTYTGKRCKKKASFDFPNLPRRKRPALTFRN